MRSLITVFSILAIIISLVGVFGLVVFDTQYRRKEIGVRKVHGATNSEILKMLNRSYIYIVLVCFALATPIGYYGIKKWLESFAYKDTDVLVGISGRIDNCTGHYHRYSHIPELAGGKCQSGR